MTEIDGPGVAIGGFYVQALANRWNCGTCRVSGEYNGDPLPAWRHVATHVEEYIELLSPPAQRKSRWRR